MLSVDVANDLEVSHGRKAVDPLKHHAVAALKGEAEDVSHGRKAVDPLKRAGPYGPAQESPVSHGRKAVDPLKLVTWLQKEQVTRSLPRSKGRGPIEAACRQVRQADRRGSPTVERPWTH